MNSTRIWPGMLLGTGLLLGLAACGNKDSTPAPTAPSVTLAAAPATIAQGSSTTLTWSSTDATACTASGAWSGSRATTGSEAATPTATGSVSYTLTCTGPGGSSAASTTVTVNPRPTVTLNAVPASITIGSPTTLTWSSTNATACTASDAWTGSRGISGTEASTPAATGTSSYTLTCTGAGGSGAATAAVTVTPPPTASLTFNGRVIDAPIANAAVTISVGSQIFTGTADANGIYSIPVTISASDTGNFVSISAVGNGTQATARFVSLLGTFAVLQTAAGSDAILNSSENFRVNVTNFSTAEAALVNEANGGNTPASDRALMAALSSTDGALVIDIATAIKLITDNGIALPAGAADTQQFASTQSLRAPFIANQKANNAAQFQTVQTAALNDPALTMAATAASLPRAVYLDQVVTTPNDDLFASSAQTVTRYDFNPDGTGRYSQVPFSSSHLLWTIDGGGNIVITFTINPSYQYSNIVFDQTGQHTINCTYSRTRVTVRQVSPTQAQKTDESVASCDDGRPDETTIETVSGLYVTPAQLTGIGGISASDVSGRTLSLKVYDAGSFNNQASFVTPADFATFNADGTGTTRFFNLNFTWTINNGTLEASFSNGVTARYTLVRTLFSGSALWISEYLSSTGPYSDNSFVALLDGSLVFNAANVPDDYYQYGVGASSSDIDASYSNSDTGVTYGAGNPNLLKGFALRFSPDGTSSSLNETFEYDANNNVVRDTFVGSRRFWNIQGDGSLSQQSCNRTADATCGSFDSREIFPISSLGTRRVWLERRRVARTSATVSISTPADFLIRYYDIAPVGDFEQPRNTTPLRGNLPSSSRGSTGSATSSGGHAARKNQTARAAKSEAAVLSGSLNPDHGSRIAR